MRAAVVGAGFAGLVMAQALLRLGYSVDIYEEHVRVGYPPHCTGVVSEYVVSVLGRQAEVSVEASYREVVFTDWRGSELAIRTRDTIYKLDRIRLEEEMLGEAISQGAEALLGERVTHLGADGLLKSRSRAERYDLVVLAEGYHGRLRKSLGIRHEPLTSAGVNLVARLPAGSRVETITIVFNKELLPRGFAWLVPLDSGVHILGALSLDPGMARPVAEKLATRLGGRVVGSYGGVVLHGPPSREPGAGRILLAGDAAALNKPLTGGGLYPNTWLADLVAKGGDPAGSYARVRGKLRRQYPVAKTLLGDAGVAESLLRAASAAGIGELVEGRMGFDDHEDIVGLVLSSPKKALALLARLARRPTAAARLAVAGLATLLP